MTTNNKLKCFLILIGLGIIGTGVYLIVLQLDTIDKIETIDNKIDDNFSEKSIYNSTILDSNLKKMAVIGSDDRVDRNNINSNNIQFLKNVGGVGTGAFINNEWVVISTGCTGTVFNKKYVITAAHCIQNTDNENKLGELRPNIVFLPNMLNRQSKDVMIISQIIRSTQYPKFGFGSRNLNHDWVILISKKELPDEYNNNISLSLNNENYPYNGFDNENYESFLSLFGYAADRIDLSVHEYTSIEQKDFMGALRTNADMNPGSSGGPMVETIVNKDDDTVNYVIHGVVSGHVCPQNNLIGVNCYTNLPLANILSPVIEAKNAMEQNKSPEDVFLSGPAPEHDDGGSNTEPPIIIGDLCIGYPGLTLTDIKKYDSTKTCPPPPPNNICL